MSKYLSAAVASLLVVGSQSAFSRGCPCFNEAMIVAVCKNLSADLANAGGQLQCTSDIRPSWHYSLDVLPDSGDAILFCKTELVLDPQNPKEIAYAEFLGQDEGFGDCNIEWTHALNALGLSPQ